MRYFILHLMSVQMFVRMAHRAANDNNAPLYRTTLPPMEVF